MFRVIWRGLYDNKKNFLAFFASIIITVSMLFVLMYIQRALNHTGGIETEALAFAYRSELPKLLMVLIPAFILIAIVVAAYSVRFYVQSRIKDYGMLMVLGIRRKDMCKIIVAEYGLSLGVSGICGLLLGQLMSLILGRVLTRYIGAEFVSQIEMSNVYLMTFLLCVVLFCGVLFAVGVMASERNLGEAMKRDRVRDKRMVSRRSYVFLGIGFLAVLGSVFLAYYSPGASVFAVVLLCGGLAVIICGGVGRILENFRKSSRYIQNILSWNQFYHKFRKQKFRILIQTMIGVLVIYFSFLMIKGMSYPRLMPNDFACVTEEGQGVEFSGHMQSEYGAEELSFPFLWVNEYSGDTRVGMSVSDYNRITGENESLNENESINIWRVEGTDDASLDNSGQKEEKNMYLGQSMNVSEEDVEYEYDLTVKKELKEEFIGFSMAGVTVLSDELFEKAADKSKFHQQFYLFNVEDSKLSAATQYVEHEKSKGILKEAFCRKTIEIIDNQQRILSYMLVGVMGVAVLFYSMFIIWLTMLAELPEKIEQYRFLDISGMRRKDQRGTLKKEHKRIVWIPMILTAVSGGAFCSAMIGGYYDQTGPFAATTAWAILVIVLAVYLVLEMSFMYGSGRWILQKTFKQEI